MKVLIVLGRPATGPDRTGDFDADMLRDWIIALNLKDFEIVRCTAEGVRARARSSRDPVLGLGRDAQEVVGVGCIDLPFPTKDNSICRDAEKMQAKLHWAKMELERREARRIAKLKKNRFHIVRD